jgi:hypothetical protein
VPGDAHGDNKVDSQDVAAMSDNWGQAGGWADGDFNGDGVVDAIDASILAANWGDYTESEGKTVPEPGSGILLILGVLVLAARRRRSR